MKASLLNQVGFTDHAVARFAERAALGTSTRRVVVAIMRDLLILEGRVVGERPVWARSRRQADLLLQTGEWMLFIACHDQLRPGRYSVVTVVNGPTGNDWRCAWRRGYISTPPPMPVAARRPWLLGSCLYAVSDRRACEGIAAAARRIHRARRDSAQAEYDRRLLERWRCWRSR